MNEIIGLNINELDFDKMSEEQSSIVLIKMLESQKKKLQRFESQQIKDKEETNIKFEELKNEFKNELDKHKEEMNKKEEVVIGGLRIDNQVSDFITQDVFGKSFTPPMSRIMVGKLFKIIGLARPGQKETIPFMNALTMKYAINYFVEDPYGNKHEAYLWDQEKCLCRLEKWLKSNNYTEQFYFIFDTATRHKFINELYEKYVINKK
jgi:hypothetical protein